MDDERADEGVQANLGLPEDAGAVQVPAMTQQSVAPIPDPPALPAAELTGTAALSADMRAAWTYLDPTARLLVQGSAAALVLVLVGLPLSVWDSAPFALLVMTAGVITIVTAWFGSSPAMRSMPLPVSTIELVATHVAAVLAIMKVVEIVSDFDTGAVVGLVIGIALAIATVVMVVAAVRRGADLRSAVTRGDQGAKLAAAGLALVLVGWAFNLSVSFWTMGQAALPLAVLTIAALTVAEAPRITSPVPVVWVGAGIAIFGALLVLGNWNELTSLGRAELVLDPGDFLGLFTYTAGTALIIAGGVLSGRSRWTPRPTAAIPTAPTAPAERPAKGAEDEGAF